MHRQSCIVHTGSTGVLAATGAGAEAGVAVAAGAAVGAAADKFALTKQNVDEKCGNADAK